MTLQMEQLNDPTDGTTQWPYRWNNQMTLQMEQLNDRTEIMRTTLSLKKQQQQQQQMTHGKNQI